MNTSLLNKKTYSGSAHGIACKFSCYFFYVRWDGDLSIDKLSNVN